MPRHHFVAIPCTPELEKGEEEGREREEEEGGAIGAPPKPPEQETTPRSATAVLHYIRSYMASNRHCITTLSPTTPMVSPQSFPYSPPDLAVLAMALHIGSA